MKNRLIFTGLAVLVCLFLFIFNVGTVFAQEDTATTTDITLEKELPADVALDERVTSEDFDVEESGVLPGSAGHFFKRIGWKFQEILETDPVADTELKINHANQELAGLKQLIEEQGFENVNPEVINAVMGRFEGRLNNINNVADELKKLKESNPEAVDKLLNNLTDKQFKYQKVLDSIEQNVIKAKEEDPEAGKKADDVFIKVTETKDKVLEHFGEMLSKVDDDDSEQIAERITKITDKQEGSEFKHLKNLEVLERLEKQVPDSAKGAIALAQENTLKFFSRDMAKLPEEARAERFEQYNRFSYGDETRQLSFLDDLKLLEDVPPEILKKIEEVKEFAIAKFEKKMNNFGKLDVLDSYTKHLSGKDFNDMVIAEQLASRAVFENNPEIKQRMDDIKNKSVLEFTNKFTDSDSQAQVKKFQELEKILKERPGDPKVMKMMQELEMQVRNDPEKAKFLEQVNQLENKMRFEFEAKFKEEGDQYFDRIGTLDPRDFEAYQQFSGENFLPKDLADKFLNHGVGQYRDYMRDMDNPENFDRFNARFGNVSDSVINEIKGRDSGFGEAVQFKRQAMERLRLEEGRQMEIDMQKVDYKERELFHQLDRARKQTDEEFWRKVNSIPYENFDERKKLFEEKRQADLARLNEEHNARLEIFNKRLELDPWCDSVCKEIQKQFIEQEFRHQKERIQDDYISQQKQIEFDHKYIEKKDFQCPDIAASYFASCPDGQNRDIITDQNGCKVYSECKGDISVVCPVIDPMPCSEGSYRNGGYTNADGCWVSGECVSNQNTTDTKYKSKNWVNHIWNFSDGSTSSSILDRTDSEYSNYIANIEAQCKNISQSRFGWKTGAGDDTSSNWQNFGIPDCSGNANTYPYPTKTYGNCYNNKLSDLCYAQPGCNWFTNPDGYQYCEGNNFIPPYSSTTSTYVNDSGCGDLLDILPGCHLMSESSGVRFNTNMDQYVKVGTRNIQYCSTNSIQGCTNYYSSNYGYCGDNICKTGEDTYNCSVDCGSSNTNTNTNTNTTASGMQNCFYPNATINGASTGYTVWCESDYYNCHKGDRSGVVVSLNNLTLGAPSWCESGYNNGAGSSTYCESPFYWDSTTRSCVSNTTTKPLCPDSSQGIVCNAGYNYDSNGCIVGCTYVEPVSDGTSATTNTGAGVLNAIKALFGF